MIAWLADWLKEIILVIMLAAFVDLMLPGQTMQRYVKVVLSLLILLTILSPILSFLRSGVPLELDLGEDSVKVGQMAKGMPSAAQVIARGEEIAASNAAEELRLIEARLEEWLVQELPQIAPLEVVYADVEAALDGQAQPHIAAVTVQVRDKDEQGAQPAAAPSADPIRPVEPVSVAIRAADSAAAAATAARSEDASTGPAAAGEEALVKLVQSYIARTWGLAEGKVAVSLAGQ